MFPEREGGRVSFRPTLGGWDPHERVKEMAVDGVSGEVLYPSFALDLFGLQDAALQEACFRATTTGSWSTAPWPPTASTVWPASPHMTSTTGWRSWSVAGRPGLPGALVWQAPPPELSFATNHYERLWAAAQDLEVPISLHILTGQPFPWPRPMSPGGRRQAFETMRSAVNSKLLYASNAMSDLIMTGVLGAIPGSNSCWWRTRVSWIPFTWRSTTSTGVGAIWTRRSPCSPASTSSASSTPRSSTIHRPAGSSSNWGSNNLMWSNDYPHPNSTWPKSWDVITRDLGQVPE